MANFSKSDKKNSLSRSRLWIVTIITVFVSTENAGAALADSLFGSLVRSIPCSGNTYCVSFNPETTLNQPFFVSSAVWSPDGKYLSVGSGFEGHVNVYDTSSWTLTSRFNREWAGDNNSVIQFAVDSQNLIMPRINFDYGINVAMEMWNIKSSRVSGVYDSIFQSEAGEGEYIQAKDSRAWTVAGSQDFLASSVGGSNNGYVLIFSKEHHDILRTIECSKRNVPDAITFNPDQSELIVAGCHLYDIEGYSVKTGRMTFQTQVDPGNWIYNFVSYNPGGKLIAVGSSDSEHGAITILNSENGAIAESLPKEHANITNLQWISDHLVLASYDGLHPDGSIARVWDTNSRSLVAAFSGKHLQFTSISPDGRHLAAAIGDEVIIGNLKTLNSGN